MSMDPWLAKIYGTDGGEDLEKTAQYMLLEKLAAEEGIDLSQVPPDQIDALAQQVSQQFGGQQPGAPQQQVPGADQPDPQLVAAIEQLRAQGYPDDQIEAYLEQQLSGGQEQPQQPAQAQQPQGQPQPQVAPQGGQPQGPLGTMLAGMQRQGGQPQAQPQPQMQAPQGGGQPGVSETLQKEAQAKFEEADFLGRVMAHSYYQELREIAANDGQVKTASIKDLLQTAGGHVKAHTAAGSSSPVRKAMEHVGRHSTAYAAGGAGSAGLGAGAAIGRATKTDKTKTAGEAAVEALAHARAIEILRANGYTITE